MIRGIVQSNEVCIRLAVQGVRGATHETVAVLDTGFTGFLTLPGEYVEGLQLVHHNDTVATLADGNEISVSVYEATVLWDGQPREVLTVCAEGGVLVGMSLLAGSRWTMDVVPGGEVTIEALPEDRGGRGNGGNR
ncbi:MAG: hypothetical protein AUJ92_16430 [Armatimonadetes bacterium CG2_30_59_28]|nr:clan AA aspartic protease [Armatimonadota bacterium]OIO91500.1 MAG: hypothetical protein AUJ92_16430 [Armatimonadetes bacterium CG2_30_59_28]PIU65941.1 MAG: clan AA aspartic protease [Armatimonadetes bacterium CG07_land_8_20_14_0_80_59_28]PIX40834.1 MAG: clan AA aspartic protease [Armatimonadetes bacterium CG_4_8_14_3_um_filter_58_9]PIY43314.1 MAG: clan AA aspartic protease [Armatimonadetes bacterium CG_4_10_14_3_um_filter_59_10]PJB61674.1 MAG: clan AA aspartic protease [Armatimonadetes bac